MIKKCAPEGRKSEESSRPSSLKVKVKVNRTPVRRASVLQRSATPKVLGEVIPAGPLLIRLFASLASFLHFSPVGRKTHRLTACPTHRLSLHLASYLSSVPDALSRPWNSISSGYTNGTTSPSWRFCFYACARFCFLSLRCKCGTTDSTLIPSLP